MASAPKGMAMSASGQGARGAWAGLLVQCHGCQCSQCVRAGQMLQCSGKGPRWAPPILADACEARYAAGARTGRREAGGCIGACSRGVHVGARKAVRASSAVMQECHATFLKPKARDRDLPQALKKKGRAASTGEQCVQGPWWRALGLYG